MGVHLEELVLGTQRHRTVARIFFRVLSVLGLDMSEGTKSGVKARSVIMVLRLENVFLDRFSTLTWLRCWGLARRRISKDMS